MTPGPGRLLLVWLMASGCAADGPLRPGSTGGGDSADTGAEAGSLLRVRWVRGHDSMDWDRAQEGLWWALGALGATLPTGEEPVLDEAGDGDAVVFSLDLDALGLDDEVGRPALERALEPLRASDELERLGAVDLGRVLLRTVYEPWHYFAVTDACGDLDAQQAARAPARTETFHLTVSALTGGERVITLPAADEPRTTWTVAQPGSAGVEVVDIMANGRQRFAIYGEEGELEPMVDPTHNGAGSPGRCMWCHEGRLMQAFPQEETGEGLSYEAFMEQMQGRQAELDALRASLDTRMDFANEGQVHAWGELLAESFLHPSAARLSREWGIPEEEVRSLAADAGLEWEIWSEYGEAEQVLSRAAADALLEAYGAELSASSEGWLAGAELDAFETLPVQEDSRGVKDGETLAGDGSLLGACAP